MPLMSVGGSLLLAAKGFGKQLHALAALHC
jgi:hypothetical protein